MEGRWTVAVAVALAAVSCGRSGDGADQHIVAQTRSPAADPAIEDTRIPDATFTMSDAPSIDPGADTSPSDPDSDPNSVPCEQLSVDLCYENTRCRVGSGRPMDPTGSCYGSEQSVGCFDRDLGCLAALTSGVDGSGKCWSFSSSCLPEGFWRAETSECPRPIAVCARQ